MTVSMVRSSIKQLLASATPATDRIALIDAFGNVVAVNDAWTALAKENGTWLNRIGPGVNYLEICRRAASCCGDARQALNGITAVLRGKRPAFSMEYAFQTSLGQHHFRMAVNPIASKDVRAVITHTDITGLKHSNDKSLKLLREFSRRLIRAQEEERQRISHEIHDDLGSRIALLVSAVRRVTLQHSQNSSASELNGVVDSLIDLAKALRNVSHGLHPPLLRLGRISAALRALCDEFEKTHGVKVDIAVPHELSLPDDVGLCIFRVSQECLQNIAKHSDAGKVRVILEAISEQIRLRISDTGRGFVGSEALQSGGLGFVSIEERVLCVRGRLEVRSSPGRGTEVCVTIPLSKEGAPPKD